MSVVKLVEDNTQDPVVQEVFTDIRRVRGTDFINNFWRALAVNPSELSDTWQQVKQVMLGEGPLDPLTREMIYIAVSTANSCSYCVHSHTAAAKSKGMSSEQHGQLMSIIAMAAKTNHLANALQVPVDPEFDI